MIKPMSSGKLSDAMKNEEDVDTDGAEVKSQVPAEPALVDGLDYYIESGLMVFTAHFLRRRGYCCNNGCRHCPYQDSQNGMR